MRSGGQKTANARCFPHGNTRTACKMIRMRAECGGRCGQQTAGAPKWMEMCRETDLSTEPPRAQTPSWLPRPHGHQERPQGSCPPPRPWPQAAVGLSVPDAGDMITGQTEPASLMNAGNHQPAEVKILRRRADFLRAQAGRKAVRAGFVLRARPRGEEGVRETRAGLTVSRKTGGAVQRNRIKRRLRHILRGLKPGTLQPGHDYVVIARPAALTLSFDLLAKDLESAIVSVHRTGNASRPAHTPGPAHKMSSR